MKKSFKAIVSGIVACAMMGIMALSVGAVSYTNGVNSSWSLRQVQFAPSSENYYQATYYFYASRATTTMKCTANTTTGADVGAVSTNGISGSLNRSGVVYTASAYIGQVIAASAFLTVPDYTYSYYGYGTITG